MSAEKALKTRANSNNEQSEFEKLLKMYDYNFNKGDLVKGKAVAYLPNGVLIDIGAKTAAYVPLKELSIDYTKSPEDVIQIGEEREFLIVKEEDEDGQLTLSLKKVAAAYSWQKLEDLKQEDAIVDCDVLSVVKGGILVDVLGLRGFVPSSHIRAKDIESLVGQRLSLKILSIDAQQNNLIMSHRKVVSDQQAVQRKDIFERLDIGKVVEGEVVRLADFGAFIDIGGIDGLLPLSQMSWRWVDHPADILTVGEKIKVEVIGIDHDKQRVSLSLKSLQPDPWAEAAKIIKVNEKISGTVTRIKHFGAFIEVFHGVEALLPYKEVVEYQNQTGAPLEAGKSIETTVVRFNPEDHRISLSVTGKITEDDIEEAEKAMKLIEPEKSKTKKPVPKEDKPKKELYQSDEETQEPQTTENPEVTHISPPCNEG
ncbi:MAG: S1 RNA-binding domain-containing protein [Candidatus Gastranaerophilales bacterium]|nr:S1 RNA-binding domain-containing protein [Candidatus Gastranaerophilales bacterium]